MRPRFPINTFPLKLSRSQEQASRIKPSCTLAASMVRVSHGPPHGLPGLHHRKSVCLRASPETSARPHCRLPGSGLWTFPHLVHVQNDSVPLPCWFTNAYGTMNLSDSQVFLLLVHRHQKPPRRFVVRVLSKSSRSILFSIAKPCTCSKHWLAIPFCWLFWVPDFEGLLRSGQLAYESSHSG